MAQIYVCQTCFKYCCTASKTKWFTLLILTRGDRQSLTRRNKTGQLSCSRASVFCLGKLVPTGRAATASCVDKHCLPVGNDQHLPKHTKHAINTLPKHTKQNKIKITKTTACWECAGYALPPHPVIDSVRTKPQLNGLVIMSTKNNRRDAFRTKMSDVHIYHSPASRHGSPLLPPASQPASRAPGPSGCGSSFGAVSARRSPRWTGSLAAHAPRSPRDADCCGCTRGSQNLRASR